MASRTERRMGKAGRPRKRWRFPAIVAALTIVLAALLMWEYMWSGEFLGKWAAAVTIISVGGSPIAYFARQSEKDGELRRQVDFDRKMISANLREEVRRTLGTMNDPNHLMEASLGKKTVKFTNQLLHHGINDGLVSSGKIGFLSTDLQQEIQDVFQRIAYHNSYLQHVLIPSEPQHVRFRYCEILAGYEKVLLRKMPQIVRGLRAETG